MVVRLWSELPAMARLVTWPRNTELTVLMKLDFPLPTCPTINTIALGTFRQAGGLYLVTSPFSLVNALKYDYCYVNGICFILFQLIYLANVFNNVKSDLLYFHINRTRYWSVKQLNYSSFFFWNCLHKTRFYSQNLIQMYYVREIHFSW